MSGPEEMFSVTVVKRNEKYVATNLFGMDENKILPTLRSQGPDLLDLFKIYEDPDEKRDYIPEPTGSPKAKDKRPAKNVKESVERIEDNSGGASKKKSHKNKKCKPLRKRY